MNKIMEEGKFSPGIKKSSTRGSKILKHVALRSWGCARRGSVQGQAG